MALARSKSAPIPLADAVSPRTHQNSPSSSSAARAGAKRLRWLLDVTPSVGDTDTDVDGSYAFVDSKFTSSPLTSPRREDREDPFSLAGFFPSRPGSPSGTFAWLASDAGGMDGEREQDATPVGCEPARSVRFAPVPSATSSHAPTLPAKKSLSMTALDDYAKEVIATEDKIGILSPLARIPSFLASIGRIYSEKEDELQEHDDADDTWENEQSVSPYPPTPSSIDEAFDADSLHASICLRRAASETFEIAAAGHKQTFDLFSPDTSEAVVAHASELDLGGSTTGWASSLYAMVVGKA